MALGEGSHGSNLSGNYPSIRLTSAWKSTNAALYLVAITRLRDHEATKNYVIKRTAQGKSKREITRCLKRYIVREIYRELCVPKDAKATP